MATSGTTCTLSPGEVHAWIASLDQPPDQVARLWQTLADDERERARRFYFPRDRDHFVVARGMLRALLACYLREAPEAVGFRYGPYGKPELANASPLRFNLSHAHGQALYALAWEREIGADIEWMRRDVTSEQIAERFFSPREGAALRALSPEQQITGFFNCWTRKEAYIKARGLGLSLPLDSFDVTLAPEEAPALLETRPDPDDAARWSLAAIDAGPGYAAAIAVEGRGWRLWTRQLCFAQIGRELL